MDLKGYNNADEIVAAFDEALHLSTPVCEGFVPNAGALPDKATLVYRDLEFNWSRFDLSGTSSGGMIITLFNLPQGWRLIYITPFVFESGLPILGPMQECPTISSTSQKVQSTQTQPPVHVIEPLVTGSRLRFDSWSPDGRWIAYWSGEGEDVPAQLGFVNVESDTICLHANVVADNTESGYVSWEEDDTVTAVQNLGGSALRGIPCQEFTPTQPVSRFYVESHVSPDGRYLAETTISGRVEQLIYKVTTIKEISTKQVIATIKWDGGVHSWAESGWLNNELFLVGLDLQRGPLYASVPEGEVGNVVSDLLGLEVQDVGYISRVGRHTDAAKSQYHLLIERSKETFLPLLLYHSELGLVEELPSHRFWSVDGRMFPPDGKWLFLNYPASKQSDETEEFWIRAVDPPDSPAIQLAEEMAFLGFSEETQKMIFDKNTFLQVLSFPAAETISRWAAEGYDLGVVWWSPDRTQLAIQGYPLALKPDALFVIEP